MANKTGHYVFRCGKFVKVSDHPRMRTSIYYPRRSETDAGGGYHDEHLGEVHIKSKDHKREVMKKLYAAEK